MSVFEMKMHQNMVLFPMLFFIMLGWKSLSDSSAVIFVCVYIHTQRMMEQKVQLHDSPKSEWEKVNGICCGCLCNYIYRCVVCACTHTHTQHTRIYVYICTHIHIYADLYIYRSLMLSATSLTCVKVSHIEATVILATKFSKVPLQYL